TGEIAIEEIHGIVRAEAEFRIAEAEFKGSWPPLPRDGSKGMARDDRCGEPLLFSGEEIGRGRIPAFGPHLGEVAALWPQATALIRLDTIFELHGGWPHQPREVAAIPETIAMRRLGGKVDKAVGSTGFGAPLRTLRGALIPIGHVAGNLESLQPE